MQDFRNLIAKAQLIKSAGPKPFITKQIFRLPGGRTFVWQSRHHRKGISSVALLDAKSFCSDFYRGLSKPGQLNWWISVLFSIGSLLFMLGSFLGLSPVAVKNLGLDNTQVNGVFFLGSVPFTSAAFLQFLQAGQAAGKVYRTREKSFRQTRIGSFLSSIAWVSGGLQFVGTLLFNINTFEGMNGNMDWLQSDLKIWVPDFVGSVCFLVSGYMAFTEVAHAYWKYEPKSISWWVVFINLLGCVAFMISAFFSFTPKIGASIVDINAALLFTFIGALCFLVGSLLMLPEAGVEPSDVT